VISLVVFEFKETAPCNGAVLLSITTCP